MRRSRSTTPSMPSIEAMPSTSTSPAGTPRQPRPRTVELDHLPVLQHEDIVDRHAGPLGQQSVLHQHAVLAVHGNEVPRLDQAQHQLELLA